MAEVPVKTSVSKLPESRVRVEVEVAAREFAAAMDSAARDLGRNLRLPGFRKGKVPPALVIQRIGREAVLDEAITRQARDWYRRRSASRESARSATRSSTLGELPAEGEALTFAFEIGVRPRRSSANRRASRSGAREPQVDDAEMEREVEGLRERLAELEPVERPAETRGLRRDRLRGDDRRRAVRGRRGPRPALELGSGRLIPGFEERWSARARASSARST